jgi:hypothetical protein
LKPKDLPFSSVGDIIKTSVPSDLPVSTRTLPAHKQSPQFDLFTTFFGDSRNLSNTIELWDTIPKYAVSPRLQSKMRDDKGNLPVHEQEFEYRPSLDNAPVSIPCKVKIQPASIQNPDGSYTQYYPSTDEELVDEVLRKIFTDQQFGVHRPAATESWVRFSLKMIQKELAARGKTRSIPEIKTSLEILSKAVYEVKFTAQNRSPILYTNPILSDLTRTTRQDYLEDTKALWCARLPALISKSINELTYRQFNYGTLMSLSTPLARWLHKKLSHHYINAGILTSHNLLFSSIDRDSGLLHHPRTSANVTTVDTAFEELRKIDVVSWFKKDERRQGKKINDILYTLLPTSSFVDEIKAANARQRDHRAALKRSTASLSPR